jgi:hypothetical protein
VTGDASSAPTINDASSDGPERCVARTKRGRCRKWPIRGGSVCATHGGSVGRVRAAADRRVARADALSELGKLRLFDAATEVDPDRVLLVELARSASAVAWLSRVVGELDAVHVVAGDQRVWLDLLNDERTRLARLAEVASKLGLEREGVDQAERQGAALAAVVRGVLDALDITAEQKARAIRLVMTCGYRSTSGERIRPPTSAGGATGLTFHHLLHPDGPYSG